MKAEPSAIVGFIIAVVAAVLVLLRSLNVDISDDTQNAIRALVAILAPLVAGLIIRQFVYSPHTTHNVAHEAFTAGKRGDTTPPVIVT